MEVKRDEYWVVKAQMFPGGRLNNYVAYIYRVEKNGDVGFMLVGDESVYWRSQVEWFEPVRRINMED